MKTITGVRVYEDKIVLENVVLEKNLYHLEPSVDCKTCASTGKSSSGPWTDNLEGSCFVLHYVSHHDTCDGEINKFSEFLGMKCDCGHEEKHNEHRGDFWFVKSVPKEKRVKFDFTKPPSKQDLLDDCSYVDCDDNDVERIRNIIQTHIDSLHYNYFNILSNMLNWLGQYLG